MKCFDVGTFVKDPQLKEVTSNGKVVKMCQFLLLCSEKRHDSSLVDEDTYLFTVWDSAAEYICKYAKKGTLIYFEASPKKFIKYAESDEEKPRISVTFRINNFKLLNQNEKSTSL